ncbi:MAG: hypothetical protein JJU00_16510 [Opitutales bacterium]|nr:hypothetical protein [Opitutales bacterium]
MNAMEALYGRPVFDEWAIVGISGSKGRIIYYNGPRSAEFGEALARDLRHLRQHVGNGRLQPGDFEFSREAEGTGFDAVVAMGGDIYLLCNHTGSAFAALAEDPLWRKAQVPFVDLTEAFRMEPLETEAATA